jgi:hypothetical protein
MLPIEIGRYIPTSSGLACWTWGWSSGTRSKASGRTAVWAGSIRTRFLCRSRLLHTTLHVRQKPPGALSIRLRGEPKVPVRKAIRIATAGGPGTNRERDCAATGLLIRFQLPPTHFRIWDVVTPCGRRGAHLRLGIWSPFMRPITPNTCNSHINTTTNTTILSRLLIAGPTCDKNVLSEK